MESWAYSYHSCQSIHIYSEIKESYGVNNKKDNYKQLFIFNICKIPNMNILFLFKYFVMIACQFKHGSITQ